MDKNNYINKWISSFKVDLEFIGFLAGTNGNDFQQNNIVYILNRKNQMANPRGIWISKENLFSISIYLSVRKVISSNWLNDRDQFLFPNEKWKTDTEFQNNCLAFTLFDNSNNINSNEGTNHWIPFTEYEVNAQDKFASNFMTDFMKGKIQPEVQNEDLFSNAYQPEQNACQPELVSGSPEMLKQVQHDKNKQVQHDRGLIFSPEATAVFDAGRELWKYYHEQKEVNVNASLYDIREYFQGRNDKGRMNSKSDDATYMELIGNLRAQLAILADAIKPKVYEYGFLKE